MARFYSNENFPLPPVKKVWELGHDVMTGLEAGNANQRISDEAVLAHAVSENRAVLTINRKHFIGLHNRRPSHCGIVVCSVDADFGGQANRIHEAVSLHADLSGISDSRQPARPAKRRQSGRLVAAPFPLYPIS